MPVAPRKTLAYAKVDESVYLYISAPEKSPAESDFNEYILFLNRNLKTGIPLRSIVIERGPGLSAAQRKLLTDTTAKFQPVVAVVTPSALGRGVVTALSWFNKNFKAFTPAEMEGAFQHVGIPASLIVEVRRVITSLQTELDRR